MDRGGATGSFVFGSDVERDATGAPLVDSTGQLTAISPLEHYRRTVLGIAGYTPSQFRISGGNPVVDDLQWWADGFAQDQWVASERLTLSYGVRYSKQAHARSARAIAPRFGATWKADARGRNRLRAGAGVFYHRVPAAVAFNAAHRPRPLDRARGRAAGVFL
jgi:outer membrane receptor protein involved in Fe transport